MEQCLSSPADCFYHFTCENTGSATTGNSNKWTVYSRMLYLNSQWRGDQASIAPISFYSSDVSVFDKFDPRLITSWEFCYVVPKWKEMIKLKLNDKIVQFSLNCFYLMEITLWGTHCFRLIFFFFFTEYLFKVAVNFQMTK